MSAVIDEADSAGKAPVPRHAGRALAAGVMILAAILFFARLGARALWSSEFRWAEIAREMRLTGNYFWPTIDGRVYYDKPLGSYWLVLWAADLTGSMNEAAARIPCAIAGLAAVGLLMILARRLYDRRTAALSGFILATCMSFVFFARTASADVETITGELAALLLFMSMRERSGGWWVVPLWLLMALTSLTKGLLGFVLPIVVIGAYSCLAEGWHQFYDGVSIGSFWQRVNWLVSRNRWFFNWKAIPAIAIAAAVYAVPFAISSAKTGSGAGFYMVYRENVVRFFHPFDHRGPVYLYVYVIFALMAPWSALLPAAIAQAHRRQDHPETDRFALVYFWATFVFFTLSGSRRSYYILPILPAGAMLIARLLVQRQEQISPTAGWLLRLGYYALAAAIAAGAVLLLPAWMRPAQWRIYPATPDRALFCLFWIACAAAVVYALRNFRPGAIAASVGIVAYLSMTYLYIFAMPAAEQYRGEKRFGELISHQLRGDIVGLAFFRVEGPIFYMGTSRPVPMYDDPAALKSAIEAGGVRWVVARKRDADDLETLGVPATIVAAEATFPWEAEVRTKEVLLRVGADRPRT
jgi:4-amino-4-deoxy-L-arabinose transferase-like glycosyltransferase